MEMGERLEVVAAKEAGDGAGLGAGECEGEGDQDQGAVRTDAAARIPLRGPNLAPGRTACAWPSAQE